MRKAVFITALLMIFILFLIGTVLTPSMANAQTTHHYGDRVGDSGSNLVGFDLRVYNPISQRVYSKTMPLDFKIDWNPVGLLFYENAKQYGLYAYKIDNNPPVSLPSNQKSNSSKDFISNPSFSSFIDVSNLNDGQHQLVIIVDMEWNPFGGGTTSVCNQTSAPILFSVQNSTASPTPTLTVPEFPSTIILVFLITATFALAFECRGKRLRNNRGESK